MRCPGPALSPVTGPGIPGWWPVRQIWIGRSLANRHLRGGNTPILHDVPSSHLEGTCRPLAGFGLSRDGRKGGRQTVLGPLRTADGCPVSVEVFPGNTSDPSTLMRRVDVIRGLRGGIVALDRFSRQGLGGLFPEL